MKCAKAAGVVILIAAVLAIPSSVEAQDTDSGIPENGVKVDMTLDLGVNSKSATKTYSIEDGRKYSANIGGRSIKIRCGNHPSGYKCWD